MGVSPSSITLIRRMAGQAALGRNGQRSSIAIAIAFGQGHDPAVTIRIKIDEDWLRLWEACSDQQKKQHPSLMAYPAQEAGGASQTLEHRQWAFDGGYCNHA